MPDNIQGVGLMRFSGKSAVVSGASGDVGRGLCRGLAAEGCRVVGIDIAATAGAALEKELRAAGLDFSFQKVDVADAAAIAAFGATLGPLDVVINNAGILGYWPLAATSLADWDRVLDINLRAAFLMTQAVIPHLREGSVILNMSSSVALRAQANTAAYSASKAGLIAFSKVVAAELAPRTRVNTICPGPLDTAMPRRFLEGHPQADQIMSSMANATMVKRLGEAQEIVTLCLYLASEAAGFITGAAITIDGGMSA
jgi:NAD(P)-dependent dehydrogenase (short-subunit alcohol dehydrogenase family)